MDRFLELKSRFLRTLLRANPVGANPLWTDARYVPTGGGANGLMMFFHGAGEGIQQTVDGWQIGGAAEASDFVAVPFVPRTKLQK